MVSYNKFGGNMVGSMVSTVSVDTSELNTSGIMVIIRLQPHFS